MKNISTAITECNKFIEKLNTHISYESDNQLITDIEYKVKKTIKTFLPDSEDLLLRLDSISFAPDMVTLDDSDNIFQESFNKGIQDLIALIQLLIEELQEQEDEQLASTTPESVTTLLDKKPFKIFISHSSKNEKYVKAFVELLESIGLNEKHIFCSSLPGYNVPLGENIYKYLRKQFTDYSLHLILILSKDYYSSPASLNEMGAGWVLQTKSTVLLLPDFDFSDIKGTIDSHRIGIKLDNDDLLPRLSELRDQLIETFNLNKINEAKWNRYVKNFSEEIRRLQADK